MNKKQRQAAILDILSENEAETQQQLSALLAERGIFVAQATLSRDMHELKIQKLPTDNDVNCYYLGREREKIKYNMIFAQSVISMDYAQNIVVVKCHAGLADAACKVIDEHNFSLVVGTVAGDDTVFVLTKSENNAIRLITQLKQLTVYG